MYSNQTVFNQAFDALDAFGYVDAEFIPYFDRVPPATTAMKDVYASVYKRADARALVIVGNLSKENRSGRVRLNGKRIGIPLRTSLPGPTKPPSNAMRTRSCWIFRRATGCCMSETSAPTGRRRRVQALRSPDQDGGCSE